jgi:1,4-alpha-glucan branching enzyme
MLIGMGANTQVLVWTPEFNTDAGTLTVIMNANAGNKGLLAHDRNDIYVHTGVITNLSATPTSWRYVKFNQNFNQPNPALKATPCGGDSVNQVRFEIANVRSFYGVPPAETISRIAILFRSGNGSKVQRNNDGSDMYIPISPAGLQVRLTQPVRQPTFNPVPETITKVVGDNIAIAARSSINANLRLLFNGVEVASQPGSNAITANATVSVSGNQRIIVEAENGGPVVRDTIDFFVSDATVIQDLPPGVKDGINYSPDGTSATLVLYAPNKNNVVVIGDFNDWTLQSAYQMKRTPNGLRYWLTITGLTPGAEYAYQYLIDATLRVADYNSHKILDPWNDPFINQAPYTDRYPNLKPYPTGKTTGIVSVLQPGKPAYVWSSATTNFQRPDKRNLVVYELLVRDFVARNDWQGIMDSLNHIAKLGVNAIHVMPFTEFEGNNSWGYNPMFMFAADKFYGPENKLKEFVEACHARGIAVILDMVLNHQFGQSPMVQMYWDAANNQPAANSPWFNQQAKHPFNVGYDMNHEAPATIDFVQRVMDYWLTEFKLDGFRWDLSKGFTQVNNPREEDVGRWSAYDQSRVNIWNRIYDQSQVISPNCYMILEHLGVDDEEAVLANKGMLLWGKMTDQFNEASMGFLSGSNFQRAYHTTRWSGFGGNNTPHLMSYAESHDEERLAQKNVRFGNVGSGHNTRLRDVYTKRLESVAAFLFTIPGPKLIWQFGELAYDSSINMCATLANGNCRVDIKPSAFAMPAIANPTPGQPFNGPRVNYNTVASRGSLRDTYGKIISLRTKYPAYVPTFVSNDLAFNLGSAIKWQWLRSSALTITTAGNFDVQSRTDNVTFPSTGTWYLYAHNIDAGVNLNTVHPNLNSTSITINTTNQQFTIPPGCYLLFTDRPIPALVTQYTFNGNGNWSNAANWDGGQVPPATIPSGIQVIINPAGDGEAVVDVPVTFQTGATLTINAGKKLKVNGNLTRE